jgi:hypothetical protein
MGEQLKSAIIGLQKAAAFRMLAVTDLAFKDILWDRHTDPRLRAFLWASMMQFPDHPWTLTSMRRPLGEKPSGHSNLILSAFDLRSKDWTVEMMLAYDNWYLMWWADKPDLIDLIFEDGRYDPRYQAGGEKNPDGKIAPHIHMEVAEQKYWR